MVRWSYPITIRVSITGGSRLQDITYISPSSCTLPAATLQENIMCVSFTILKLILLVLGTLYNQDLLLPKDPTSDILQPG